MKNDINPAVGDNLRTLREGWNLKQEDIASLLSVHPNTISAWENHRLMPAVSKLQRLADYYQINVADLINERGLYVLNDPEHFGQKIVAVGRPTNEDIGISLSGKEKLILNQIQKLTTNQKNALLAFLEACSQSAEDKLKEKQENEAVTPSSVYKKTYRTIEIPITNDEAAELDGAKRSEIAAKIQQQINDTAREKGKLRPEDE